MRVALVLLLLLGAAGPVSADDLEDKDFGLRLSAALTRFSRYPDSAGLAGAGGGSPWSSSPNPASSGMNPSTGPKHYGASAQYAQIHFDEGTIAHVASVSGSYDHDRWGSWQPSVLAVTTNRATRSDGPTFEWDVGGAELQWATMVGCDTAVGVNLSWLDSEMDFDLGSIDVSESDSTTLGLRVGALRRCPNDFHIGVAVELSGARAKTTTHDFMGLGAGDTVDRDTTYAFTVRPGIYKFLTKDLTAYVDYQFGHFWDHTGTLTAHRLFAGLDLTVREGVYVRAGTILDNFNNAAATFGIGIAPSETLYIDLAYQYDVLPEVELEFGKSHVFSLGVTVLF